MSHCEIPASIICVRCLRETGSRFWVMGWGNGMMNIPSSSLTLCCKIFKFFEVACTVSHFIGNVVEWLKDHLVFVFVIYFNFNYFSGSLTFCS